ncbi:MAG: (d)CMP kinase [Acidobacteriaceae bacterium]|nr:(d)CMP kinase [Acidobacteriaceae bacterium]
MSEKRVIIAIDGPAGSGKSTLAKRVAERLGFIYINTGAMYRAVALWALQLGVGLTDMHRLEQLAKEAGIELTRDGRVLLNGEDVTDAIREPHVSDAASQVSAVPGVRRALLGVQRGLAEQNSVVMEGRDIGSVVFPDAQVKIFLDADPAERARRRALELQDDAIAVEGDLRQRDERDRGRAEAPLVQAPDAELVDTTGLSPEEVEEVILRIVRARTSNGKGAKRHDEQGAVRAD